jgi:hypothetical protein
MLCAKTFELVVICIELCLQVLGCPEFLHKALLQVSPFGGRKVMLDSLISDVVERGNASYGTAYDRWS